MSVNGRCALSRLASTVCPTYNAPAGGRFFPPVVALYVVKLACERPDVLGRSLSQWDSAELARQLVRDGVSGAVAPGATGCRVRRSGPGHCVPLHAPPGGMV